MHIGAYAKKRAEALAEIGRKTGVELSRGSEGIQSKDPQMLSLQQLEKIARELPEPKQDMSMIYLEDAVKVVGEVKGVGVTLAKKIEVALKEL